MTTPKTPEEALAHVRAAAEAGNIEFASDTLCAQLDHEVQIIYRAIRAAEGKKVKRDLWASDRSTINDVLDTGADGKVTAEAKAAVELAGMALSIPLSCKDLWSDAAMCLRAKTSQKS